MPLVASEVQTIDERLHELYAQIPEFSCIDGCTDCCGPVPATLTERKKAPLLPFDPFDTMTAGILTGCLDCPYSGHGQCDIYEDRPFMCRLYGAVDDPRLKCPHGRGPLKPLTIAQGERLLDRYLVILKEDTE